MNRWKWQLCWLVSGALALAAAEASSMGDECDWTGSGLSEGAGGGGDGGGAGRGVTPVYVRCREGRLTWLYPRGALRLIFQLPSNEQDFTVCVHALRAPHAERPDVFLADEALDFRERERRGRRERRGVREYPARLFLEGPRGLLPLYAHDDGDERDVRCFPSRRGRAAVYVEALEGGAGAGGRAVAALRYEARPLPLGHYDPAAADCRPCSDEEMSLAFCTSDLVSRGTIVGLEQRRELDTSQLTLQLTKLIRHTGRDASAAVEARGNRLDVDDARERERRRRRRGRRRRGGDGELHAHVHVPAQCEAAGGEGEFVFMARRRLGRLALTCAPRLQQWQAVVGKMNAEGSAHCLLKH